MKKIFAVALSWSLCCCAVMLTAAEVEQFIPVDAPAVIRLNAGELLSRPWCQQLIAKAEQNQKFAATVSGIRESLGVKWQELIVGNVYSAALAGGGNKGILLFKTSLPEERFAQLFSGAQAGKKADVDLTTGSIGGKKVYVVTPVRRGVKRDQEAVVLSYLASDVVLLTDGKAADEKFMQSLNGNGTNPLLAKLDRQALLALIIDVANVTGNEQCRQVDGKLKTLGNDINTLQFELNLYGKFKDKATVSQFALQIQLMFPSLAGMVFGKDEKLAMEVASGLRVTPQKDELQVSYRISWQCLEKIEQYLSNPANRQAFERNAVEADTKSAVDVK